jgi:hypothetical protein
MYAQILVGCQSRTEDVGCEYCIGRENCELRFKIGENKMKEYVELQFTVPLLTTRSLVVTV